MAIAGDLVVRLGLDKTPLAVGLAAAKGELAGFSTEVSHQSNIATGAMRGIGLAGAAVVAGTLAVGAASVDAAANFQEAMSRIQVNARLSQSAAEALGQAVLRASIGTTSSATDMAKALGPVAAEFERVTGRTLNAADALFLLRAAGNLSVAADTDLSTATKSIADLLLVYHLRARDAAGISNLLFAGQAQLGVGVDTLSNQLQRLQPRIAGSGITLVQLLAIAREMEPTLGTGQRAVFTLGAVLQNFLSPTAAAQKVIADLGLGTEHLVKSHTTATASAEQLTVAHQALYLAQLRLSELQDKTNVSASTMAAAQFRVADATQRLKDLQDKGGVTTATYAATFTDAQGNFIGFGTAIDQLRAKLTDLSPAQRAADLAALFGKNWRAAEVLIEGGSAALGANVAALNGQGTAASAAAIRQQEFGNQLKILRTDITDAAIALGQALLPAVLDVAHQVLPVVNQFAAWAAANPDLAASLLKVAGALGLIASAGLVLRPLISGIGALGGLLKGGGGIITHVLGGAEAASGLPVRVTNWPTGFGAPGGGVPGAPGVPPGGFLAPGLGTLGLGVALPFIMFDLLPALFPGKATPGFGQGSQAPLTSPTAGTVGSLTVSEFVGLMPGFIPAARAAGGTQASAVQVRDTGTEAAAREGSARTLQWQFTQQTAFAAQRSAEARAESALAALHVDSLAGNSISTNLLTESQAEHQILANIAAAAGLYALGTGAGAREGGPLAVPRTSPTPYQTGGGSLGTFAPPKPAPVVNPSYIGKVPTFQTGGSVPGIGPMLAVVHGGETVTPAGQGSQMVELHSHLHLDGNEIGEVVERFMLRAASIYSSGFAASNPVTGA